MAANTDIRIAVGMPRHPKIIKAKRLLGQPVLGAWLTLLCHVGENRPSGSLVGMDDEDIAIAAEWDGDAARLIEVLVMVKLLDKSSGGLVIHDWAKWNPLVNPPNIRTIRMRDARKIGRHTKEDWLRILAAFDSKCANCGTADRITKDHIIPVSRRCSDAADNLQPLCRPCNSRKHTSIVSPRDLVN